MKYDVFLKCLSFLRSATAESVVSPAKVTNTGTSLLGNLTPEAKIALHEVTAVLRRVTGGVSGIMMFNSLQKFHQWEVEIADEVAVPFRDESAKNLNLRGAYEKEVLEQIATLVQSADAQIGEPLKKLGIA